jgi:UDP-glucose 4-epimerase
MNTVFISGAAGLIGSNLCRLLVERGVSVVACDSLISGYCDNVPDRVRFEVLDCANLEAMTKLMDGCDVIFHCAALPYEGLSVFSPHLVARNIVDSAVSMATAAVRTSVRRFVYCSSMARYGAGVPPFGESDLPEPVDPYGISKLAAERLIANICSTHGVEWAIAVPHNVIGPGQRYDDPYRNVAAIFANRMLQGKQPVIYGDGKQKRSFCDVEDVVRPLIEMGISVLARSEIVNLGPDSNYITILELAERIGQIVGLDIDPIFVPSRPQEVKFANCAADKSKTLLAWRQSYSLDQTLNRLVEWIRGRGCLPFCYNLPLEIVRDNTPKTWQEKII